MHTGGYTQSQSNSKRLVVPSKPKIRCEEKNGQQQAAFDEVDRLLKNMRARYYCIMWIVDRSVRCGDRRRQDEEDTDAANYFLPNPASEEYWLNTRLNISPIRANFTNASTSNPAQKTCQNVFPLTEELTSAM